MKKELNNIYLIGMSGVGKSTVGKLLANRLKWAFIDVNQTIEAIYDKKLTEIIDTFGEESFRKMESTLLEELSHGEHQVFACNCDTIIEERKLKIMKSSGVTIWLDVAIEDLLERINKMENPVMPEGDPVKIIQEMMNYRNSYYQQADVRIATEKVPPEVTTEKIIQLLRQFS
ncbi:MAG: shikimate kinase [Candidatus Marinimicrobia bacterium]|nr:shikimate kinase [Candidatus Neomarinimicrobiota bacterium]MCH8068213.1 shikimate kinase [Candidatus Neomarinimicrobiota bacterium]